MAAIGCEAHIAGCNAPNVIFVVVEHFCSSETGKNFYTQLFGLFSQPATQTAKTDNVIAGIVHGFRNKQGWNLYSPGFVEYIDIVLTNLCDERSAERFPVGE